jgi:hypothetical protein
LSEIRKEEFNNASEVAKKKKEKDNNLITDQWLTEGGAVLFPTESLVGTS